MKMSVTFIIFWDIITISIKYGEKIMKNTTIIIGIFALIMISAVLLFSCGGPKSLARETVELLNQTVDVQDSYDLRKMAELQGKYESLERRIENLSDSDMDIYIAELLLLYEQGKVKLDLNSLMNYFW